MPVSSTSDEAAIFRVDRCVLRKATHGRENDGAAPGGPSKPYADADRGADTEITEPKQLVF
jgi:hypothetical protein